MAYLRSGLELGGLATFLAVNVLLAQPASAAITVVVQSPAGKPIETASAQPNYAIVLYRADGITEVASADVWNLADNSTWRPTPSFAEGETAILKLWRCQGCYSTSYPNWSSWKTSTTKAEVTRQTVTIYTGQTYTITSDSSAAEGIVVTAQTTSGGVLETGSEPPNYALVLYRSDGITEVAAQDVWSLSDDRTWTVSPNFQEGETAVLKLWRCSGCYSASYPNWSSWKSSTTKAEVTQQTFALQSGQSYTVTSDSSAAEGIVITAQTAQGGVLESGSTSPNYALVLYRSDGVTEVAAQDVWSLADDRTWSVTTNFQEGEAAVLKLWRCSGCYSASYPNWSSWKSSTTKVEVTQQPIVIHSRQAYTVTSDSSAAESLAIIAQTAQGGVLETGSTSPNYALVLYRSDGVTEVAAEDVWSLGDDRTWSVTANFQEGEAAVLKLWRCSGCYSASYPNWSSWKSSTTKVEVTQQAIVIHSRQAYTVTSDSAGAEGIVVTAQTAQGGLLETGSTSPNYAVVLYRADGVTEVAAEDVWSLTDDRTWSVTPDLQEGETAVLKLWVCAGCYSASYPNWSSWKSSTTKVEVARQTIALHRGQTYSITSGSRAAEGIVITTQTESGGVVETGSAQPNYALVLYRSDGLTEVAADDVWSLTDDRTWSVTTNFQEGETAVLALWRCNACYSASYPSWSSWKASTTKEKIAQQTITVRAGAVYSIASPSSSGEVPTAPVTVYSVVRDPDGRVLDSSSSLPNWEIALDCVGGCSSPYKAWTYNLAGGAAWTVAPTLALGSGAVLRLRRYDGTTWTTEAEQQITLTGQQTVTLTSQGRPVKLIGVTATDALGRVIDTRSSLPNWQLQLERAGGSSTPDVAWTYNLAGAATWTIRPNYLVGDAVVVRLRRFDGTNWVTEAEQATTLEESPFITLSSQSRPLTALAVMVTAPDGKAIDSSSVSPNWQVQLDRPGGSSPAYTAWTYNLTGGVLWTVDPNQVVGDDVVVRLRRYDGANWVTEREQTVTLGESQLVRLTSLSRPVQGIAITALDPSGRILDTTSTLPNWRLELYRADGTNLTNAAWTYQITGGRVWTLSPNFVEDETAVLRLRSYDGANYALVDEKTVALKSGAAYDLASAPEDPLAPPRITIGDVSVPESNFGTYAAFSVSLSKPSTSVVTADYATMPFTAQAGSDYTTRSGRVTFPAGSVSQTITVSVVGDTVPEADETFAVNLSNATNAILSKDHGTGTILDDDGAPAITVADVSVTEGSSGTTTARFTVTLSGAPPLPVTVNYAATGGTATPGIDFQPVSGQLPFGTGVTTRYVDVPVTGDAFRERNETFYLTLSGATNAVIRRGRAMGTIVDDDGSGTTGSVDVLDPACDATSCPASFLEKRTTCRAGETVFLKNDVAALAAASTTRSGVATDGVTVLLLRVASTGPVTFSLKTDTGATPQGFAYGRLNDRNGCNEGLSVTVQPEAGYAFAAYRAPMDYPAAAATTPVSVQVQAVGPGGTQAARLSLRPPPVVLVHGIWSDASTWTNLASAPRLWADRLQARGFVATHADYGSAPASFDPTKPAAAPLTTMIESTKRAQRAMRAAGVAVTRVDVVGHSMGGLVARARVKYQGERYERLDNYQRGEFRKLITLGTPHKGSELANWLVQNQCDRMYVGVNVTVASFLADRDKQIGPAVFELQTASPALTSLGSTPVRSHAIVGVEPGVESGTESTLNWIPRLSLHSSTTIDGLLGGDGLHDTIVSVPSQTGGLPTLASSVLLGVVHTDVEEADVAETESPAAVDTVTELLMAATESSSFAFVPAHKSSGTYRPLYSCGTSSQAPADASSAVVSLTPSAGQVFRPGEPIAVSFAVSGGNAVDGAIISYGSHMHDVSGPGPFAYTFAAPASGGAMTIRAATYGPGPDNYEAAATIFILPAEDPLELEVTPSELRFDQLEVTQQISVRGIMPDGTSIDLTPGTAGTTYVMESGTAAVASVTSDGQVTAEWDGQENLIIQYGSLTATVPVTVAVTNHAPTLNVLPSRTMTAGEVLDVPLSATDPDGNALTLSGVDLPAFASVHDNGDGTGYLHLAPTRANAGVYELRVAVADDGTPALGDGQTQSLTVGSSGTLAGLHTVTPCRVADTRNAVGAQGGPALAANASRAFPVTGLCGIPASATAVAMNVTVVGPSETGDLRIYPAGTTMPLASTINFTAGQVRANNAIIPLGAGGEIAVQCDMAPGSKGATHFLFDVTGYFE